MMPASSFRLTHRLASIAFLAIGGCKGFTEVSTPDVVQRERLENLQGVQALYTGALHRFINAVGGQSPYGLTGSVNHYLTAGLMSDELFLLGTYNIQQFYDQRVLVDPLPASPNDNYRGYPNLQGARVNATDAISAARPFLPTAAGMIAHLYVIKAYTEIFLAELYCSGVPLSDLEAFQLNTSPAVSRVDMYRRANADVDSAMLYGKDTVPVLDLARVARVRIALGLGDFLTASTAGRSLPTNFAAPFIFVAPSRQNGLFGEFSLPLATSSSVTVSDREGTNGLDFVSSRDPRVGAVKVGTLNGFDWYRPGFVTSATSPLALASGTEVRLAEAEAALQANNVTEWLNTLNTLRAGYSPALPALADPGTTAGRVDLLFRERAFWLFLTGNRISDLRRLVRQYGRAANTVFPTGQYKPGLTYGNDVNSSAWLYETTYNPNYHGCLDRGA